ncbi:hypothetical protein FEM48_ZijujUnG0073200 [Ziziphus jujuba var. spinosa]|uniref:Mitochondrial Rho GTPase n=1 Tax=Ziziphus jujuba var. spinosa TaxID=714518 RepID=A0A978U8U6_ZIZJJ|nr:hypothetical protein FEM48_ZijujUnG0073200 [Ziziphus jujuba var. spinosa]
MEEGKLFNIRDNDWLSDNHNTSKTVRIIVLGDTGSGKTSLIMTALTEVFLKPFPIVLEPFTLPKGLFPGSDRIEVIDTCADDAERYAQELKKADVVLLTFSCNESKSYDRLSTFWLPRIREIKMNLPLILVGCKVDLKQQPLIFCSGSSDDRFCHRVPLYFFLQPGPRPTCSPLLEQYPEIEMYFEISACKSLQDLEFSGLLGHNQLDKHVHLLLRCNKMTMPTNAIPASLLNDAVEVVKIASVQQEIKPDGITFRGFWLLHRQFLPGNPRVIWCALRYSGFGEDLEPLHRPDLLHAGYPDETMELTCHAISHLCDIFKRFNVDNDGLLQREDYDRIFRLGVISPFSEVPYKDAAERDQLGRISLNGFLSEWALVTLLDPFYSLEILKYIGFKDCGTKPAVLRTRGRRLDCMANRSGRDVFQCFVFGPRKSGKSTLLNSFVRRPSLSSYIPTSKEHYAVNVLDFEETKKTLVLREIPEDGVKTLLSTKTSLAGCDIAAFVHDSSDGLSWERATQLLVDVVGHGEDTGYEVPCLIIAAKVDLESFPLAIEQYERVTNAMGMQAPISVSLKASNINDIFMKILRAARYPRLNSVKVKAGTRKLDDFNRECSNCN